MSAGLIHFVDEDFYLQVKPYAEVLEARGFDVKPILRASDAFDVLIDCRRGDLVIIDIMLARGDPHREELGELKTAKSVETGLVLLDLLCANHAPLFPTRAALFTHVERPATVQKAERMARDLGIPLWRKNRFRSGFTFAETVEQHLNKLNRRQSEKR